MRTDFLPLSRPSIGPEEIAEVIDSLQSGWLTTGPKVQRFEQLLAERLGLPGVEPVALWLRQPGANFRQMAVVSAPRSGQDTVGLRVREEQHAP